MAKALHSRRLPSVAALSFAAILHAQNQRGSPTEGSTAPTSTHARVSLACTTIEIKYVGKIDSPSFPIIISSSAEEAERYKEKLFNDTDSIGGGVYIIRESIMKKIADIPLSDGDVMRPSSGDGPRTWPGLLLVLATGKESREVSFGTTESVSLLRDIKRRVSEYPPLVERLVEIEGRLNRHVKRSHSS